MVSKASTYYQPELDVLRFVAFLGVFLHHSTWASPSPRTLQFIYSLTTGLQLFFALSAFLITELLLREEEKSGTIHIQAFFVRRILRIWPLYLFAIFACFMPTLLGVPLFPKGALVPWLLLAGNWWVYTHNFTGSFVGPLWSISVEEQFYLVWPFLARMGVVRVLKPVAVGLLLVGVSALIYSGVHSLPLHKYWTNSLVQFQFFGMGALLALGLHRRNYAPTALMRCGLLLIAIVAFLLQTFVAQAIYPVAEITTVRLVSGFLLIQVQTACALLAIYKMHIPSQAKPLIYLGRISYGLYVFHLVCITAAKKILIKLHIPQGVMGSTLQMLLALVIVISVASLSYRFLEVPFLQLKKRFTFVPSREA